MPLEVDEDEKVIGQMREEISQIAGEGVTVSALSQRSLTEIRHVDSWSSKEDVLEALSAELGTSTDVI